MKELQIIKLAIFAVGGQGGGVLAGWINTLAKANGFDVQMTSVAGVAQRTGATIYYVEMSPKSEVPTVFALSPSPGDLDVVIAAELMEAGRAVLRGFVSPQKTTLIASTHRILAISEKQTPGDGRSDAPLVEREIVQAARHAVCFDMETLALEAGSMISASLFGGLAKSGVLPFSPAQFEAIIKASPRGAKASLRAFHAALDYVEQPKDGAIVGFVPAVSEVGPPVWQALLAQVAELAPETREMAHAGLRKTVDYQDIRYGEEYLERLLPFDQAAQLYPNLGRVAAKYIANAMCYDDILRVADLKTRTGRSEKLRRDQQIRDGQIAYVTEYFHPRAQEVTGSLPAGLGAWMEARPRAMALLARLFRRGRHIKTHTVSGFFLLWCVAGLRPMRRHLLRHRYETAHLQDLLETAQGVMQDDPALACEILSCQQLIKGYSDTHARGHSKFSRVLGVLNNLKGREDAADWVRRLRKAALEDEAGEGLNGAINTVKSFT